MKSKIVGAVLISIGFFFGVSALSVLAQWVPAPNTPPTCPTNIPGCNAPIHVGNMAQTKTGPLTINYSLTDSIALILGGKVKIIDGNQAAGKVLTSDATGVGTWQGNLPLGSLVKNYRITFANYSSGWIPVYALPQGKKIHSVVLFATGTSDVGLTYISQFGFAPALIDINAARDQFRITYDSNYLPAGFTGNGGYTIYVNIHYY